MFIGVAPPPGGGERVSRGGGSAILSPNMDSFFLIGTLRIFQILLIPLFLFLLLLTFSHLYVLLRKEAPWVPTSRSSSQFLLSLAEVRPGETVLDLGCGDGSILLVAAREFQAKGIGYDVSPVILWLGRLRCWLAGVSSKVSLRRGDIFRIKIPQVDVVTLYLFTHVNSRLLPRLKEALPQGTRIATRVFPINELTPLKTAKVNNEMQYLYEL